MFTALLTDREDGRTRSAVTHLSDDRLPAGDVTVAVRHSTVNYKDGLCLAGQGGLVRDWPHVAGIDFAGVVEASDDPAWRPGDEVVLTGWRVGETRWGGYATRARVRGAWLVRRPEGLTLRETMAIGTAGLTAALALLRLEEEGLAPGQGPVLVTGASGGVGSVALALLAAAGHEAVAVTGRPEHEDYLRSLGAARIVPRADLSAAPAKPLESETWAGCIDAVGGAMLARVLAQLRYGACAAAVGLAGGAALPATVIPFLLRGVSLLGIDSVMAPIPRREAAWARLARDLDRDRLAAMTVSATLDDVPALGRQILAGQVRGRVVVDLPQT
ncbi:MDR family oxidoreductase [Rubellimicrobium sp. CFH 75288]|uniref:MDR family oxidoreductase n=1 Tax=Rubellimicrobium sp. CFH 75288 TaxID=2697034 RepID=UPI0014131238|nr:MDR family oxidoreductase [Rubellimicrobium sp. CFH 75288]NAZ36260.1 acryloyl-CoA reductase [Rubellimicrobium sp. CFH 75288]